MQAARFVVIRCQIRLSCRAGKQYNLFERGMAHGPVFLILDYAPLRSTRWSDASSVKCMVGRTLYLSDKPSS
jgi:hypothetical protein